VEQDADWDQPGPGLPLHTRARKAQIPDPLSEMGRIVHGPRLGSRLVLASRLGFGRKFETLSEVTVAEKLSYLLDAIQPRGDLQLDTTISGRELLKLVTPLKGHADKTMTSWNSGVRGEPNS